MSRPFKRFVFFPKAKSRRVASVEEAHQLVQREYPGTYRHGSVGSWHWRQGDEIVAEAIAALRGDDWFLRLKD